MVRTRDFPENRVRIVGVNAKGVAHRNIAVNLAVNEKNRDSGGGDSIFWRNLLHVEFVLPAGVEEGEFDYRPEESASKPGTQVEWLAHAVVGDFAKVRERRFGSDGAETRLDGERLQELCGAHGFAEAEDAARVIARDEKIEPEVNVVAFEQPIGGELAAARAVSAGVRKKHAEAVSEKKLCVSCHANAVVGETVEKDDLVAATVIWVDGPGIQRNPVGPRDGNVIEIRVKAVSDLAHVGLRFLR